jgi:hypothetical protein
MFISGVWFMNKGRKVYLTPDAYFYFNYWKMKDGYYPKFRYSQLYEIYFENFAESIPNCIGTFSFKKRRDGRTTRRMCRSVWKAIQPKNKNSKIGMQSKTGTDVKDICWETLLAGFRALPIWVKPDMAGSSEPATKLEFARPAQRLSRSNVRKVLEEQSKDDDSLNTIINWRDTVADAYDGDELLDYTCDELAKWKKANVLKSFGTYTKCFWKDGRKVGHWHGITSPSESNGKEHDRSVAFWNMADPAKSLKINSDGTFEVLKKSWFILRYFTSALEGYGEACDIYGDCDSVLADQLIEEEINNADAELKSELRRQLPKKIEEILVNTEDLVFTMGPEMLLRKIYLESIQFKDPVTKEPKYLFYNLDWEDGIRFGKSIMKPSKYQEGFSESGRFCFQKIPPKHMQNKIEEFRRGRQILYRPPDDSENVIGGDPYDYRRTEGSQVSKGGAVGGCALDFYDHGCKDDIFFSYLFRPKKPAVYYEDMILACWLLSAYFQVESKNKNIIDHFEDAGCMGLMLAKNPKQQQSSEHKGNPTTVPLIDEFCTLIDSYYSYEENLEKMWMEFMLQDNLVTFDPNDTKKAHLTMAQGQFHLGVMKRRLVTRNKRIRKQSDAGTSFHRSIAQAYGLNV